MNEMMYKHVLFKDLKGYVKRNEYFDGYTDTEKAWIRKNLDLLDSKIIDTSTGLIRDLIAGHNLIPGGLYTIPYLDVYKIVLMAISEEELSKQVILITDDPESLAWDIKFDIEKNQIIYMKDLKGNEAWYDFKYIHKIFDSEVKGNTIFATNIKLTGESNYNILKGDNILFNVPVCNLIGEAYNVKIDIDEIGLNSNELKSIVHYNDTYYIDYLDLETLTHLFYALDTIL